MEAAIAVHLRTRVWADYLGLTKPRVVLLHLITATSAMFLAARGLPPTFTLLFTLAGGGLVASASNTLNCYFDRDIDKIMARTKRRPLPAGRLKPYQALVFGIITGLTGLFILGYLVNLRAAALSFAAMAYYILVYTLGLKRRTYWSTVIGSGAGAVPPLVGWVAVTGGVEITPLFLAVIISLWTLPHFWALAILRRNEYKLAGIEVLPRHASRLVIAFCFLLVTATILLVPIASLGILYLSVASLLGLSLLNLAARLRYEEPRSARHLYLYSILYIVVLFGAMIVD